MGEILKDIQGDISVSGNITAGLDADIKGSVSVGHNLTVKGWLHAKNIRERFMGVFDTEAYLNKSFPDPRPGWSALVSSGRTYKPFPYKLYVEKDGKWQYAGDVEALEFNLDVSNMAGVTPSNVLLSLTTGRLKKMDVVDSIPEDPDTTTWYIEM